MAGPDAPALADLVAVSGAAPQLRTRFRASQAAVDAVAVALGAAVRYLQAGGAVLDARAAVAAFASERLLRVDGEPVPAWDPLAGDYRCADGWVRLHTNYAAHRLAATRALGLPAGAGRAEVGAALREWTAEKCEDAVIAAGGAAAAMRSPRQWREHPHAGVVAAQPLVRYDAGNAGPVGTSSRTGRPDRVRVLDLTRVIAGPTAAKVLGAVGADVLRLDPPGFEEVAALEPDTTAGKRCALLDLRGEAGRERFGELLRGADVLIDGLRPGALDGLGWAEDRLRRVRPDLVLARLSAWGGSGGPWAGRRGFDSLVQTATGIAWEGMQSNGADAPVALPLQVIDHTTGWLLAAAVLESLTRRRQDGKGRTVELLLARTGHWLDGLGRCDVPIAGTARVLDGLGLETMARDAGVLETVTSSFGAITRAACPGVVDGQQLAWAGPPSRLGAHPAAWTAGTQAPA